jgi:propanediol dehydratase small subunit
MTTQPIRTLSGKNIDEIDMQKILSGKLSTEDLRISAQTLRMQAEAAEKAGYRQVAQNLRRAAELTGISNDELFEIYDQLRPGRARYEQLLALAQRLETTHRAPLTAAFVRHGAEIYHRCGVTKKTH